ncbi:MAG TPA: SDR family NAD(P)-dependent oxidoreductase [Candidatus Binatia bacterium]|jgi:NAD(P)-dependent dehydrogenase (short-subunit alcohol dehydrogenase family)|nr:SDR family NAD(P)-dependent oxidoreductase [Candidatus Binatia bacterium]
METAIIAGVGPGMGAALARAFAKEGYAVGLLSRRAESGEPVAGEIVAGGGKALVVPTDVTHRQSVISAVERIRTAFGPITALAHNASGYGRGAILELDPEQVRLSFETNVMGALHLAQAVIPDMLQAGHGFISLTGATAALRGRAGYAPLAIGKSGLRMLGQSLAREFHPKGIHVVHVIVDGQIDNPRLRAREPNRPADTVMPPSAIADAIIACLKQPKTAWSQEMDLRPAVEPF